MRKLLFRPAFVIFMLVILASCGAGRGPGRIKLEPNLLDKVTIQTLAENWADYNIFYFVWPADYPLAIVFDPKDDDRRLISTAWSKIDDQPQLLRLIKRIQTWYEPRMYRIIGPGTESFGFSYSARDYVYTWAVDRNTLRIYDFEPPSNHGP